MHLTARGLRFEREYRAIPDRKYRWDFALVPERILIEIQGAIYRGGAHTTVSGLRRDYSKLNAATLAGYRTLMFHGDQVRSGEAADTVQRALRAAA